MGEEELRRTIRARRGVESRLAAPAHRIALVVLAASIGLSVLAAPRRALAQASSNNVDQASSTALTAYLKQNRLPLVGAQVMNGSGGTRRVVLYGFVATDEGKHDAERKVVAYVGTLVPSIDDRLVIKPELATMTAPPSADQGSSYPAPVNAAPASGMTFGELYRQIQQYGIKNPPGE
jgi:hypothetical protein